MALKYILTSLAVLMALPAAAAEPIGAVISIELNSAKTSESACTLSFAVLNGYAAPLSEVIYEAVLFDSAAQVERLTLFNMGELPSARQRMRQFSVPGVTCEAGLMLSTGSDIKVKG